MAPVSLMITRPEGPAARFAEAALARFGPRVKPILSPVLRVEPTGPLPNLPEAAVLVFTSAQGVAAYTALGGAPGRSAFCVGAATASAASAAGLAPQASAGGAAELARAILQAAPREKLWHLRGAHAAGDLAGALRDGGLEAREAVIYAQRAQPLTAAALAALAARDPLLVPVFSPRSAAIVAADLAASRAALCIAALSGAVAARLPELPEARIEIAAAPDADAMLDALAVLGAPLWGGSSRLEPSGGPS